jgi:hypothetical protein
VAVITPQTISKTLSRKDQNSNQLELKKRLEEMILVLVVAVKSLSNAMVQLKNVPMCQFYNVTMKYV